MRRLIFALALLLYAAPLWADCVELPIINVGTDKRPEYEPQIPAGLPNNYGTDGIPTVNGKPKFSTVITCYPDSVKIPPKYGPMTADQAAAVIHNRDATRTFNPDALKIPDRPKIPQLTPQSSLRRFFAAAWSYLGPSEAWAGSETDDFNRADSSDLNANWDAFDDGTGLVPCRISTNAAAATTVGVRCFEAYNHYLPSAIQSATVTFLIANGGPFSGSRDFATLVRMTNPASSFSGYQCQARVPGSSSTLRIRRIDAGVTSTLINDDGSITWADTDTLTCDANGSTITAKRNGATVISWTDATYTTGRAGIQVLDDPASDVVHLDSFTVTDSAATTVVRHRPIMIQ